MKWIIIISFLALLISCKSVKNITGTTYQMRYGGTSIIYNNLDSSLLMVENHYRSYKKSVSIVEPIIIDSNLTYLRNIVNEVPEIKFINSFPSNIFSINIIDKKGVILNDLSYAIVINENDSLHFGNNDYTTRFQNLGLRKDEIKKLELTFHGASIYFIDSLNTYPFDSLVFQLDSNYPLNYYDIDYSFRDYKLIRNTTENKINTDSNILICLPEEKGIYYAKKETLKINKRTSLIKKEIFNFFRKE